MTQHVPFLDGLDRADIIIRVIIIILFYFILFFVFLCLHLRHMGVPRLGVELELQLLVCVTATATAMLDLSHTSAPRGKARSLTHSGQRWNRHPHAYELGS